MSGSAPSIKAGRILIVMPTWVGDVVMATPTLRALRAHLSDSHLTALMRPAGAAVLDPCPWLDAVATSPKELTGRFDVGILLANSFRAAWTARGKGCKRLIGYARDGRSWMLSDQLFAPRGPAGYVPMPALKYYLEIARYLGAEVIDSGMELFVDEQNTAKAQRMMSDAGVVEDRPLVLLNPGASFGPAKLWGAKRYAQVADRLFQEHKAQVAVSGSIDERPILDQVIAAAEIPIIDLQAHGIDLRTLKGVMQRADLLITNDTGPRHIAAAFNTPVVTIFGPTDPRWTEIDFALERQLMVDVFCGPCQQKHCPLDHRCMTGITPEMVYQQAAELLAPRCGSP